MEVTGGGADERAEGVGPDHRGDARLEQGSGGHEVGPRDEHRVDDTPGGDGANGLGLQRGIGPPGEAVGVEHRPLGVDERQATGQCDSGQHRQQPGRRSREPAIAHHGTVSPTELLKVTRVSRVCILEAMTYVIVGSCIKDDSCIEVCPVDCIHPKPGAPDFETAEQLYIDPEHCIDCDACVEACPIDAIFAEYEVPEKFGYATELNAEFFVGNGTVERTAA